MNSLRKRFEGVTAASAADEAAKRGSRVDGQFQEIATEMRGFIEQAIQITGSKRKQKGPVFIGGKAKLTGHTLDIEVHGLRNFLSKDGDISGLDGCKKIQAICGASDVDMKLEVRVDVDFPSTTEHVVVTLNKPYSASPAIVTKDKWKGDLQKLSTRVSPPKTALRS